MHVIMCSEMKLPTPLSFTSLAAFVFLASLLCYHWKILLLAEVLALRTAQSLKIAHGGRCWDCRKEATGKSIKAGRI